jgi:hypothetical protein
VSLVRGIVKVGRCAVRSFFAHRMAIYAEQLSYRGIFGVFPFILVFALLDVLRVGAVFDRLVEAAMGMQPHEIPEPLEPVAEGGRAQAAFLRPLIQQAQEVWSVHCPDLFIASFVSARHERIRNLRAPCPRPPGSLQRLRKTRRRARLLAGAP